MSEATRHAVSRACESSAACWHIYTDARSRRGILKRVSDEARESAAHCATLALSVTESEIGLLMQAASLAAQAAEDAHRGYERAWEQDANLHRDLELPFGTLDHDGEVE